ncbi:MAG: phytoene/squalene synthase family protein, partial [Alphaproteobacteria bacterium]
MAVIRNLSYCADQVRRFDHDRYLSALFVPSARREAVFALYAFNLEVAKTREMVSETMLGQIRLQWWREALEGIYKGETRAHPVVEALTGAVAAADLSLELFRRLIDAREQDLDDAPPVDLETLERYAEGTSGVLLQLVQQVLGHRQGPAHEAARRVGVAWSLTGLLRAVAFHARAKRQYLPRDMLDELGVR